MYSKEQQAALKKLEQILGKDKAEKMAAEIKRKNDIFLDAESNTKSALNGDYDACIAALNGIKNSDASLAEKKELSLGLIREADLTNDDQIDLKKQIIEIYG